MKARIFTSTLFCLMFSLVCSCASTQSKAYDNSSSPKVDSSSEMVKSNITEQPPLIYLYEQTPDIVEARAYEYNGVLKFKIEVNEGYPKETPIMCSVNGAIYYILDDGVYSRDKEGNVKLILSGLYSQIAIVGDKLYYCTGIDSYLYQCSLNGSQQKIIIDDPKIEYLREDALQGLSFIVNQEWIYYVTMDEKTLYPDTIVKFNMRDKSRSKLISMDSNVKLIKANHDKLYFAKVPHINSTDPTITLYELNQVSGDCKIISNITSIAVNDESIYYTNRPAKSIYSYEQGISTELLNVEAPNLFTDQQRIYFSNISNEPYQFFDLQSKKTGTMKEGFNGEYMIVSLNDESVGTL